MQTYWMEFSLKHGITTIPKYLCFHLETKSRVDTFLTYYLGLRCFRPNQDALDSGVIP